MKYKKHVLLSLICASVTTGCGQTELEQKVMTPNVRAYELGNRTQLEDSLYFPAVATAAERSHLSFRVSGEISSLLVKEGDRVTKGDVIAILDPTDYQLDVDNAQASFTVSDSQFKRSKPLVDKGLLAKSQFDEIAAQRQIALRQLQLAKLKLSFTKLMAPVDGIISRVSVDQFENIQIGQQIVNIHSVGAVEIQVQVPDSLYVNQPSELDLENIEASVRVQSGNEYTANLKEFTTEPDPQTGSYTVTLVLPMPEDELILDGMAVEVTTKGESVGLELNAGTSIPIEAVFNADGDSIDRGNKFVWVINDDNTVSKTQVVVGKATRSHLQVLGGLEDASQVVVGGVAKLREGMQVNVLKSQEASQ